MKDSTKGTKRNKGKNEEDTTLIEESEKQGENTKILIKTTKKTTVIRTTKTITKQSKNKEVKDPTIIIQSTPQNLTSEQKVMIPEEPKAVIPEQKAVIPEQKAVIPEQKAVIPEQKAVIPEQKAVIPEEPKVMIPEQKIMTPEEQKNIKLEEKKDPAHIILLCAGDENMPIVCHWYQKTNKFSHLFVCFYGKNNNVAEIYKNNSDYFVSKTGPKWQLVRFVYNNFKDIINKYEYIWIPDDDLYMTSYNLKRFFDIARTNKLEICQPSFMPFNVSNKTAITINNSEDAVRKNCKYTEIQAPMFRIDIFKQLFPAIDRDECKCGWGLDGGWSEVFNTHIIDHVSALHTRPLNNSQNTGFYKKFDINPWEELKVNINFIRELFKK